MKFLVTAVLFAGYAAALAAPEAGPVKREPVLSILPVDGFEGVVEGGFERLWEGVQEGLARVEQLWTTHDAVQLGVEQEVFDAGDGLRGKSVYQVLAEDEQFSKFLFLISQDPATVSFLSSSSGNFTLFAPTNAAFPAPGKHLPAEFGNPLSLETLHRYFSRHPSGSGWVHKAAVQVLHALVQYHILPSYAYSFTALAENSTAGTALTVPGALLGAPQRIKLNPALRPFPTLQLNFAGHITAPDRIASNGIVHGVNRALQPGLSAMDQLYAVPWLFPFTREQAPWVLEITASALAHTGLSSVVSHKPVFKRPSFPSSGTATELEEAEAEDQLLSLAASLTLPGLTWTGSPALTIFAPSNKAWARLPPALSKWLYSPWGEFALEKLLRYHIVNGTVLFADYVYPKFKFSAASLEQEDRDELWPKYDYDVVLPTLLGKNFTLPIHVSKRPVLRLPGPGEKEVASYRMVAAGVPVAILDMPARNGVIQVVERVLNPLKGKGKEGRRCHAVDEDEGEDEWEGWEDWFVKWARET
ncbi:FAS1 domain-containing protein [Calocera viscosa TUFC12733]|uniref:FAS1 domain-containing protein n=1 Tax=Calocera viscosa (strain TUFC12733) TaxID=1330018 RepID=A0A167S3I3_CALVF|nr:FAS1 domain-containing protein [Calocera viscosa TUFC12733]